LRKFGNFPCRSRWVQVAHDVTCILLGDLRIIIHIIGGRLFDRRNCRGDGIGQIGGRARDAIVDNAVEIAVMAELIWGNADNTGTLLP